MRARTSKQTHRTAVHVGGDGLVRDEGSRVFLQSDDLLEAGAVVAGVGHRDAVARLQRLDKHQLSVICRRSCNISLLIPLIRLTLFRPYLSLVNIQHIDNNMLPFCISPNAPGPQGEATETRAGEHKINDSNALNGCCF